MNVFGAGLNMAQARDASAVTAREAGQAIGLSDSRSIGAGTIFRILTIDNRQNTR